MSHKGKLLFVVTVDKTALSVSYDSGHKVGYKRHRIEIRGREAGRGSNGYDGNLGCSADGS